MPALLKVFETIEMPLVPVLARIEQNGVFVDAAMLKRISHEFGERMQQLQAEAWKEAGGEFNLGSPLQLQQILFDKLKLPVIAKTPKGQPSTGEDVLEQLAEQHPLPRKILDWRALSKLRSTYTESLPLAINPQTGRIHTSYGTSMPASRALLSAVICHPVTVTSPALGVSNPGLYLQPPSAYWALTMNLIACSAGSRSDLSRVMAYASVTASDAMPCEYIESRLAAAS